MCLMWPVIPRVLALGLGPHTLRPVEGTIIWLV